MSLHWVRIATLIICLGNVAQGQFVCDLNADGDCDHGDIDQLYVAFGNSGPFSNPSPDLDGDNVVGTNDIAVWLMEASAPSNPYKSNVSDVYVMGDVNLSGEITSVDLGLLLNEFGSDVTTWDEGDMNGDGGVDSTDLGLLLNNFGFASASAVAVPEPSSTTMLALLGIFVSFGRNRQNRAKSVRPAGRTLIGITA